MAYIDSVVKEEIMKEIEFAKQVNPQMALGMQRLVEILDKHDVFLKMSMKCPVCDEKMVWSGDHDTGEETFSVAVCQGCDTEVTMYWNEKTMGFNPYPREAQCIHCGKTVPSDKSLPGFVATPPEKKKYDQFACCLGI